jgi:hypothetical protein
MQISEALQILGLHSDHVTAPEIRAAYQKKAFEYDPSFSPVGIHMMQIVENAYEVLKRFSGPFKNSLGDLGITSSLEKAVRAVAVLEGITIEICGVWIWISGSTERHKAVLKEAGYDWAPRKHMWYFRPEHQKARRKYVVPFSMDEIRQKFGSKVLPPGQSFKTLVSRAERSGSLRDQVFG